MKFLKLLFLLLSFLFLSNANFAQIQYSLDSVQTFSFDSTLRSTKVVKELNADKHEMKSYYYNERNRIFGPSGKIEFERHSDNTLQSETLQLCYNHIVRRDTCARISHRKYNLFGDVIERYHNSIFVSTTSLPSERWEEEETFDSTIVDLENRPIEVYLFEEIDHQGAIEISKTLNNYSNGRLKSSKKFEKMSFRYLLSREDTFRYDTEGSLLQHKVSKLDLNNNRIETELTNYEYLIRDNEKKIHTQSIYKIDMLDTILTYKAVSYYEDLLTTRIIRRYNEDGTFRDKSKEETYFLDDKISIESEALFFTQLDDNQWSNSIYSNYFYHEVTSPIDTSIEIELCLFPNPARDFIVLKSKDNRIIEGQFQIINSLGQIVQRGDYKMDEQINVDSLPSGNYYLRMDFKYIKHFILQ